MSSVLIKLSFSLLLFSSEAFFSIPLPKAFPIKSRVAMSVSTEASTVPNWRVLPRGATDYEIGNLLFLHSDWSEDQYAESLELYDRFMDCDDAYVAPLIQNALNTLEHAYRLYGPKCVICSYNGGKDAVVILHLVRASHAHYYRQKKDKAEVPIRPRVVYFDHPDEFPEILAHLVESVRDYDLDMVAFDHETKFREGLQTLVDNNIPSGGGSCVFPLAFVLGTRSTDPNAGSQGQFAPSSHYMPPFMRINPVLDWTYGHVWHFLRLFHLPCTFSICMAYVIAHFTTHLHSPYHRLLSIRSRLYVPRHDQRHIPMSRISCTGSCQDTT